MLCLVDILYFYIVGNLNTFVASWPKRKTIDIILNASYEGLVKNKWMPVNSCRLI